MIWECILRGLCKRIYTWIYRKKKKPRRQKPFFGITVTSSSKPTGLSNWGGDENWPSKLRYQEAELGLKGASEQNGTLPSRIMKSYSPFEEWSENIPSLTLRIKAFPRPSWFRATGLWTPDAYVDMVVFPKDWIYPYSLHQFPHCIWDTFSWGGLCPNTLIQ